MRGRVLAETSGKSPKPAKKNNHHETAYAALDWDIGPDTTAGVGYLYQQLYITPDNGLPAYKNGKLLPLPQKSFTGANWNHFEMQSHDAFADVATTLPTVPTAKSACATATATPNRTTPSPAARSMTNYR